MVLKDYSTADGLPDSRVAPILQDHRGYFWLATQAGITRYDGREFISFGRAKEIPGVFGRAICEDSSGAIWFGYTGFSRGGLIRLKEGSITEYPVANRGMSAVVEGPDRNIWIANGEQVMRLHFLDPAQSSWTIDTFPECKASAFCLGRDGTLWIGGVNLYEWANGKITTAMNLTDFTVRAYGMYESHNGELWLGGFNGAVCYNRGSATYYSVKDGLPERGVWTFAEDPEGNFWVGTMDGLYRRIVAAGKYRFRKEQSFGSAVVYDICVDHEGNVWFASAPGLRKLIAADFVLDYPDREELARPGFGPIEQDSHGSIYFGSRNKGVYVLKDGRISQLPISTLTVTDILQWGDRLCYAIWRGGVILLEGSRFRTISMKDGLRSEAVHAFAQASSGALLVGTAAGISMLNPDGTVHRLSEPGLDNLTVFDIKRISEQATARDRFYLATDRGARVLNLAGDSVRSVDTLSSIAPLADAIIYEVLVDRGGTAWFGTDGMGLVRSDGRTFRAFTTSDGLPSDRIYALAQDSIGRIWVGTSAGLSEFDGAGFRTFTAAQGFGEIGIHGLMVDREGKLWASNFPGVTKVAPQPFPRDSVPPPIYLTEIRADTERVDPAHVFVLEPSTAAITFHFAGLSYTDEAAVRYSYKLEGYDAAWSAPTRQREVRYTHLPAGDFTFSVIARNPDGVWSVKPALCAFTVLPPVWARWWFLLLCIAAVASVTYAFFRYRLEKLLEIERTRSRIAMDLHDDIGSSLTRISMMTEVALRQGKAEAIADYLRKIGDTSRELIDSLGDIVWSVDPRHDDLQNVIRRIVQFGQETFDGSGIQFETDIAGSFSGERLPLERRRDIYLIFKEAVNNAARHSKATLVKFSVLPIPGGVRLELKDNGIGFIEEADGAGEGSLSMRARGERASARLSVVSVPGGGTTVGLEMKTG